jgi:hypothetical protein
MFKMYMTFNWEYYILAFYCVLNFFISFPHHKRKYGHTIYSSFLTCFWAPKIIIRYLTFHIQLYSSVSVPILACIFLVIGDAVIYRKMCSPLRLNINC